MELHVQPILQGEAPRNMAVDTALLESAPSASAVLLRHYSWSTQARTFGYTQRYTEVYPNTTPGVALCRRPTGGSIVDHGADWTYCLAIPPQHAYFSKNALHVYQCTHQALLSALQGISTPAKLLSCEECKGPKHLDKCFPAPSPFDIIHTETGQKLAGAAQKRTRQGMLIQGSVQHITIPDPAAFLNIFAEALAKQWDLSLKHSQSLPINEGRIAALENHYASPSWQKKR